MPTLPLVLPRSATALSFALDAVRRACLFTARTCRRAARRARDRARRASDRDLLLAMTARELNDLGIGRCEAERLAETQAHPGARR